MGEEKLERTSSCQAKAARLSRIQKENGGRPAREMGEGQSKAGLVLLL
jgi:hypothetical protein